MKLSSLTLQLLAGATLSQAFSPRLQQVRVLSLTTETPVSTTQIFSTQWDDEDEEIVTATSFEDAGESLKEEEAKQKLGGMDDFDSNPAVSFNSRQE